MFVVQALFTKARYTYVQGEHEDYHFHHHDRASGGTAYLWLRVEDVPVGKQVFNDLIRALDLLVGKYGATEIDLGAFLVGGALSARFTLTFEGFE